MKIKTLMLLAAAPIASWAGIPSGYYAACEGACGKTLLQALEDAISSHTNVGYNGLWDVYATSDAYPDGKIWDMYSTKHWTYDREQCGSYSAVGDCYNREHSMPKSWFDGAAPMYSDAFHIYPTDGKVNAQRSNYPYGECANGTTLPSNGNVHALGKLGASTYPGYAKTVFEPDDEYKGDFARTYFYMAACYNSLIDDWDSDMLAGNSYPVFTSWAASMLMKWHRQDPVSDKEKARNEAVYAKQHNRNPFIDHPELAEHIWGDKKTQPWSANGAVEGVIAKPIDGSVYDFGFISVGAEKSIEIPVKGANLTSPVTFSTQNAWFTLDKVSIPAAEANAGAKVVATWDAEEAGQYTAQLTFSSGSASSTVTLQGIAVEGITAYAARDITDCSFVASWTYVGDEDNDGNYDVCYKADGASAFTRVSANAEQGWCLIDGLAPETDYIYWVTSQAEKSNEVRFTTAFAVPFIQLLYDGVLFLQAAPGTPSEAYEIIVDAENIGGDIEISVSEPFQLSSDKAQWTRQLSIKPDEDRFYLRVFSQDPGNFTTVIKLQAGSYVNDDIEVSARVTDGPSFVEDFEADAAGCDTYNGCEYNGRASAWYFSNAGIWEADKPHAHDGNQCLRMGKSTSSCITMTADKPLGAGIVKLYAKRWSASDGNSSLRIEYSLDGGQTWDATTEATVDSDSYSEFAFTVNKGGNVRIRVQQTSGSRFLIDDISISDFIESGLDGIDSDYRSWDAFCRDGSLAVEAKAPLTARIYGVDGIVYFEGAVPAGFTAFALPKGLYIVAVADFSRRVMVK